MVRATRLALAVVLLFSLPAASQTGSASVQPAQSTASSAPAQSIDVKAAVDAYLAKMPPAQRARSDAYFEGGYWLMLWDFLLGVFVL